MCGSKAHLVIRKNGGVEMYLYPVSDLHIDINLRPHFGGESLTETFLENMPPADILVLAGDICNPRANISKMLFSMFDLKYKHVLYVPGNHEYYGSNFRKTERALRELEARYESLHVLMNDEIFIDGQHFVGSTMWFSKTDTSDLGVDMLADSHKIRGASGGVTFRDYVYEENEIAHDALLEMVNEDSIVITHHAQHHRQFFQAMNPDPKYPVRAHDVFYDHSAEEIIDKCCPKLWIFGHTHEPANDVINHENGRKTLLYANPLGYVYHEGVKANDFNLVVFPSLRDVELW